MRSFSLASHDSAFILDENVTGAKCRRRSGPIYRKPDTVPISFPVYGRNPIPGVRADYAAVFLCPFESLSVPGSIPADQPA